VVGGLRPLLTTDHGLQKDESIVKGWLAKLPWLAKLGPVLLSWGAWGLFGGALLDSGFVPLPEAVDFWLMKMCVDHPQSMWLYATATTAGSILGCLVLFYLAQFGGHAFAERKLGHERATRLRNWFERYELLTVMVPAFLPPPVPFKAFVIIAGVVEVHLGKFLLALVIGRTIRYFGEAFLAVRYGPRVWHFFGANGGLMAGLVAIVLLISWLIARRSLRQKRQCATGSDDRS
jgi:membrane protein YqaA with SNARE-associated domain